MAVDLKNGAVKWEQPLTSAVWSGMVVLMALVYFGDLQGAFHAFKAEDGSSIWKTDVNGAVIAKPASCQKGWSLSQSPEVSFSWPLMERKFGQKILRTQNYTPAR